MESGSFSLALRVKQLKKIINITQFSTAYQSKLVARNPDLYYLSSERKRTSFETPFKVIHLKCGNILL